MTSSTMHTDCLPANSQDVTTATGIAGQTGFAAPLRKFELNSKLRNRGYILANVHGHDLPDLIAQCESATSISGVKSQLRMESDLREPRCPRDRGRRSPGAPPGLISADGEQVKRNLALQLGQSSPRSFWSE